MCFFFSYFGMRVEPYRRSYIEGTAVFDVRCKNTGFAIARDLTAKGIEGVDIDIIRVTPNSLRIQLVN